jgi:hypothetical protein
MVMLTSSGVCTYTHYSLSHHQTLRFMAAPGGMRLVGVPFRWRSLDASLDREEV